jgi:hypothetical protein
METSSSEKPNKPSFEDRVLAVGMETALEEIRTTLAPGQSVLPVTREDLVYREDEFGNELSGPSSLTYMIITPEPA